MLAGNDLPGKTWPNGKHISYRLHHHFSLVNQVNQYPVFSFERFISGVEFPINQGFPERLSPDQETTYATFTNFRYLQKQILFW